VDYRQYIRKQHTIGNVQRESVRAKRIRANHILFHWNPAILRMSISEKV